MLLMWLEILGSVRPVQTKFKRKQATLVQGTFLYNLITRISFRFSKLHLGSLKFIWNFWVTFGSKESHEFWGAPKFQRTPCIYQKIAHGQLSWSSRSAPWASSPASPSSRSPSSQRSSGSGMTGKCSKYLLTQVSSFIMFKSLDLWIMKTVHFP